MSAANTLKTVSGKSLCDVTTGRDRMHHKPPGVPKTPARPSPHGLAASKVLGFVDEARMYRVLADLVPDVADRRFVYRCLVGEGPIHHRGANYILVALLAQALDALGVPLADASRSTGIAVPMRLPPYLAETVEEGAYPITLPTQALSQLAAGQAEQVAAMVDCLTDGPPQHALANVIMVTLIERLLASQAHTPE